MAYDNKKKQPFNNNVRKQLKSEIYYSGENYIKLKTISL